MNNRQLIIYDEDVFNDSFDDESNAFRKNAERKWTIKRNPRGRESNAIKKLQKTIKIENNKRLKLNSTKKLITELKIQKCKERYAFSRKIGHGTYGEVFRAHDKSTNTMVAIKRICYNIHSVSFCSTFLMLMIA